MEKEQVKQNAETRGIPILAENLPKLRVGQYWFDDDTCADDLIEGKSLKAVIVLINGQDVYGDIFTEREMSVKDVYEVSPLRNFKLEKNQFIANVREMELIADNLDLINDALKKAEKTLWQGYYWTDSDCCGYETWIKIFPEGKLKRSGKNNGSYQLRPLIRKQLP